MCWIFVATQAFSGCGEQGLRFIRLPLWWLLLLWSTGSRHMGLDAPLHVESSQTRDQTCTPELAGGFPSTASPRESPRMLLRCISIAWVSSLFCKWMGILSSFWFGTIVNKVTLNIHMQVCVGRRFCEKSSNREVTSDCF